MKFGVREIANVVFRAKAPVRIGNKTFQTGQPVLYIDTAKTSTIEGAATTVYAQGGRGNARLVAWEGEKTLTFTVEDALISPVGLSVLTGAGLIKSDNDKDLVHVHMTSTAFVSDEGNIDVKEILNSNESISTTAPFFVLELEKDGSLTGNVIAADIENLATDKVIKVDKNVYGNKTVMLDFYVEKLSADVSEIQIDAENFAGYYYVEADTLFRRQEDGVDMPANITIPNVKIQSNFTFSMASSGDPSTFTFTMDAMPGYTYFNNKKKVLCVIQVVEDVEGKNSDLETVMGNTKAEVDFYTDADDARTRYDSLNPYKEETKEEENVEG